MEDCSKAGVVYENECIARSANYIGETEKTLTVRMRERRASKRRESLSGAHGKHTVDVHGGNDWREV